MPTPQPNATYDVLGLGNYSDYSGTQDYDYDSGVTAVPLAGATARYRLVRLHGGFGVRNVRWNARRSDKPPIIPSMANAGDDVFLEGSVALEMPCQNPGGSGLNWSVAGNYTYVQNQPRIVGQTTFSAGSYPFPLGPIDDTARSVGARGAQAVAALVAANPLATKQEALDAFGRAVQPTDADRWGDTYLWPFTILPPGFTNDNLIGA